MTPPTKNLTPHQRMPMQCPQCGGPAIYRPAPVREFVCPASVAICNQPPWKDTR